MTDHDRAPALGTMFDREGDRFLPTPWTRSVWDPNSLRGPVVTGLIMHQVEERHADRDFQVSRVTIDMFRLAPMVPVTVRTEVVREGNRIRVVDVAAQAEGLDVARASVVMLRRTAPPEGRIWTPPSWDVPEPDRLPEPELVVERLPIWEQRTIPDEDERSSGAGEAPRRAWLRDVVEFVRGERPSPLVRAGLVADYANPFANGSDTGLHYINADATLYLHRDPVGPWIGITATTHHATSGVAIGSCALYDLVGPFGQTSVTSIANRRRP